MSDVIDFEAAKEAMRSRGRKRFSLHFVLDKHGCLHVLERNAKGGTVHQWTASRDRTVALLHRLAKESMAVEKTAYYQAHPAAKVKADAAEAVRSGECTSTTHGMLLYPHSTLPRRRCSLTRRLTTGPRGCTRLRGHEGDHRDQDGEWSAPWPHERFCGSSHITRSDYVASLGIRWVDATALGPAAIAEEMGGKVYVPVLPDGRCARCSNPVELQVGRAPG